MCSTLLPPLPPASFLFFQAEGGIRYHCVTGVQTCALPICMYVCAACGLKLGQPVPESNLVSEAKSSRPQAAQTYMPCSWLSTYLPVKGRSVPCLRMTSKRSEERRVGKECRSRWSP